MNPPTKDPITDKTTVFAYVASSDYEYLGQPAQFAVGCGSDTTSVLILWNQYLTTTGSSASSQVRVDDGTVQAKTWTVSGDTNNVTGLYGAEDFVKSLFGHDTIVIRMTLDSDTLTATFPITGIESAIKDVRAACHW